MPKATYDALLRAAGFEPTSTDKDDAVWPSDLSLDQYQAKAIGTAIYPDRHCNLVYPALKLAGEAGEIAEKVGKLLRDAGYTVGTSDTAACLTVEQRAALVKELGDVLWYVAALADELGVDLSFVACLNVAKLARRKEKGTLGGSGDDR